MKFRLFIVLCLISLMIASCDSESTPKYLEFADDLLLPQAPIGASYDFTFTVTYGEEKWDESTGYFDSEIVWGFDNWKLNGADKTSGPANMTFSEGQITGTADSADAGLWSFDVTIQKGKKFIVEKFYLPIAQNIEIVTDTVLPNATTEIDYSANFSAKYGNQPYYWSFDNWTKNGSSVSAAPQGFVLNGAGSIEGKAANSEVGHWTVDATVYDTSIPTQLSTTMTFEFDIYLKLEVPTNYATIQAAVDAAQNVDTVYLNAGTYQGSGNRDVDFTGKSLTIIGNPQDPTTVEIDCQGSSSDPHRAFLLASAEQNCVIDGVTIKNGHGSVISSHYRGGAILCNSSVDLTVQNCIFTENATSSQTEYIYGGTIYLSTNCNLTVKNTEFEKTTITTNQNDRIYGGNIFADSDSIVVLEDVVFSDSIMKAGYYLYGGEIYLGTCSYDFKNVLIKNGDYKNYYYRYIYGGTIYATSCVGKSENLNIVNNSFEINYSSYAYFYGSVAYFNSCTSEFKNCLTANNSWSYTGTYSYFYSYGGFYMNSGSSIWDDCIFSNNVLETASSQARIYGQCISLASNTCKLRTSYFLNNTANSSYNVISYSYGGMLRVYSSSTVIVDNCVFAYNKSGNGSAAIHAGYSSQSTVINNTTIYKNQGFLGGGLFSYGNTTMNNSILWDNSANYDGNQIYTYSTSYVPVLNNSLYRNQGGDVYNTITPVSCVTSDPYFKDTGSNSITGDCTFSADEMTVMGTPGTSVFTTELMKGDLIYLTSDGNTKALVVVEVVSDSEVKVAGYYTGNPGTGAATVMKSNFNLQHTSKGDANDSPCVDSGDNSKVISSNDIAGNTRIVDGNGNSTPTVDMGAYELQ